jgi:hypothetical protein
MARSSCFLQRPIGFGHHHLVVFEPLGEETILSVVEQRRIRLILRCSSGRRPPPAGCR